jgi:vacuolar-type H+-ATPase subunit E/Vma4
MAELSALHAAELTSLSHYELGHLLNEIDEQRGVYSKIVVDAERALGKAESQVIREPNDRETKALARQIRGNLNAAKAQLSYLNKRQSLIQSVMRAMGPIPQ